MILLYTRPGCGGCDRVKSRLNSLRLDYREYKIGEDVTRDFVVENFPNHPKLPIAVINEVAYSGAPIIETMINQYREDFGKELLTEDRNEIGKFVNEGG